MIRSVYVGYILQEYIAAVFINLSNKYDSFKLLFCYELKGNYIAFHILIDINPYSLEKKN